VLANDAVFIDNNKNCLNCHIYKRRMVMAHVISDDCTTCGACLPECPVEAISEGSEKYSISADTCTDCGACADVCPTEAISPA
jgi:ferredoxin